MCFKNPSMVCEISVLMGSEVGRSFRTKVSDKYAIVGSELRLATSLIK